MKNKGLLTLFIILAFSFTLIPISSAAESNSLDIACTVKLPEGMVVPANKVFQIQLASPNDSLIGTIPAGKNQVTIKGPLDTAKSPTLAYTVLNDAGLNVVSSGWYKVGNTATHIPAEAYNFRAVENPKRVIELPLEKGVALSGTIIRPAKSQIASKMTVQLSFNNSLNKSAFHHRITFSPSQTVLPFRTVIAPGSHYEASYHIQNYYANDIILKDTFAKNAVYSSHQSNMLIPLVSGIEINGLVSIPDHMPTDHTGHGFRVLMESIATKKTYESVSQSSTENVTILPKARSMVYSIVAPPGNYIIKVQNMKSDDPTIAYAVDMVGIATKTLSQAGVYTFTKPTSVNLQGLFKDSPVDVAAPVFDNDLVLKGYVRIPETIQKDFTLELSLDVKGNQADYSLYHRFEAPQAGNYPYSYVVPRAITQNTPSYVKATLHYENGPFNSLPNYAKTIYINPNHLGSLVRENSAINPKTFGIERCDFNLMKGTMATFLTKLADNAPLLESESHYGYTVLDAAGKVIVKSEERISIPAYARTTNQKAYVFVPDTLKTFKIGLIGYDTDLYKAMSYYSDNGSTKSFTAAKLLKHGDLANPLTLTAKPTLYKEISGLIMLPDNFPAKHPAIPINITAEKNPQWVHAKDSVVIEENERSVAFSFSVPVEDASAFVVTFNSNMAGIVQRQYYSTLSPTRTSVNYYASKDFAYADLPAVSNIGVMKLIAGSPVTIEISNPNAISDTWIELQAIEASSNNVIACYGMDTEQVDLPIDTTLNLAVTGKPFVLAIYQSNTRQTTYIKKTDTSYIQVLKKTEATVFDSPVSAVGTPFILMPMQ